MGGIPEAFAILKNHICSTHVHDNNGDKDTHLWPGNGSTDWKQTMELLRTAPLTPPCSSKSMARKRKSQRRSDRNFPEAGRFVDHRRDAESAENLELNF